MNEQGIHQTPSSIDGRLSTSPMLLYLPLGSPARCVDLRFSSALLTYRFSQSQRVAELELVSSITSLYDGESLAKCSRDTLVAVSPPSIGAIPLNLLPPIRLRPVVEALRKLPSSSGRVRRAHPQWSNGKVH